MLKPTVTKLRECLFRPRSKIIGYRATLGTIECEAPTEREAVEACERAVMARLQSCEPHVFFTGDRQAIVVHPIGGGWGYHHAQGNGENGRVAFKAGWCLLGEDDEKQAFEAARAHAAQYEA